MNWHTLEDSSPLRYLDGELADRSGFEAHLQECAECRAELAAARHLQRLTQSWAAVEPPPGLADSIQGQLRPRPTAWSRAWLAAAAAILLAFFGFWRLRPQPPAPERAPQVAQVAIPPVSPDPEDSPARQPLAVSATYRTESQPNVIALAGQVLTLSPFTRLEAHRGSDNHYLLRLTEGEVRVQEHGEMISVVTEHLQVDPLGTDYQVTRHPGRTQVVVYTGRVKVTSRYSRRPVVLAAGGKVEFPHTLTPARPRPSSVPQQTPAPRLPEPAYPTHIPQPKPEQPPDYRAPEEPKPDLGWQEPTPAPYPEREPVREPEFNRERPQREPGHRPGYQRPNFNERPGLQRRRPGRNRPGWPNQPNAPRR